MAVTAWTHPACSVSDIDLFAPLLSCPDCRAGLTFTPADPPATARGAYGVLRCPCAAYPVIDGVPVLLRGRVAVRSIADSRMVANGPDAADLVRQVEAGQGEDALVSLLSFPVCPWPFNLSAAGRAASQFGPVGTAGLAVRRQTVRRWLRAGDRTAEDWFSLFYWRSPTLFDPFSYFFFRFAQPRHLATLALAPALGHSVLDLACGYGHTMHSLTAGDAAREAVGLDQNFHQAWVGQHFVAPAARYICADAERPLPFGDGAFASVLCSDAFYYFADKDASMAEIRRVADGGTAVLARVANALVPPHDGYERTPEGYRACAEPWPSRWFDEATLTDLYRRGRTPDFAAPTDTAALAGAKWLYGVAAPDVASLSTHDADSDPASDAASEALHLVGTLSLNPLYESSRGGALRFRWPSTWFEFENTPMSAYHAVTATMDADASRDLAAGRHTPRLDALAQQFVVIGLPERYVRPAGRPWPVVAHRALSFGWARLRRRDASPATPS